MIPRDFSQIPVEQLARLLLDQARHDPQLPRRTPANGNEPPPGWSAPAAAEPSQPWFPERLSEAPSLPGQERIADLVSQALSAAEEAAGIALATREASRRANRGAAIAMALGVLGAMSGIGAGAGNLLFGDTAPEQAAIHPVPFARPAAERSGPDESATTSLPALAPATFVRVLPAVPSQPRQRPDPTPPRRGIPGAGFGRAMGTLLRQRTG